MPVVNVEMIEEDIAEGVRGDCRNCAVSLSIGRLLRPGLIAQTAVTIWDIYTTDNAHRHVDRLPSVATNFIYSFDGGGSLSPITFPLDIPSEFLREGVTS